jgi:hypothetical protein
MNNMRKHLLQAHGKDLTEADKFIDNVWNKLKVDQEGLVADGQDRVGIDKDDNESAVEDLEDNSNPGTSSKSNVKKSRTKPKVYSGGPLQCRLPDCSMTFNHPNSMCRHLCSAHSSRALLCGETTPVLEVQTGRMIGLFDLFSVVVVCKICKAIREGKLGQEKFVLMTINIAANYLCDFFVFRIRIPIDLALLDTKWIRIQLRCNKILIEKVVDRIPSGLGLYNTFFSAALFFSFEFFTHTK